MSEQPGMRSLPISVSTATIVVLCGGQTNIVREQESAASSTHGHEVILGVKSLVKDQFEITRADSLLAQEGINILEASGFEHPHSPLTTRQFGTSLATEITDLRRIAKDAALNR